MDIEPITEDHPAWLLQREYTFLRPLGKTGFGEIFLVRARYRGEEYALKMGNPEAEDPGAARAMLEREGELLRRLRHPHIVRLVADNSDGSDVIPHLLLEYIPGPSLEAYKKTCGVKLACLRLALGIASAVAYLHSQGVQHNDLHPMNVVVDERAVWPLVIDFGLALARHREVDESLLGLGRAGWVHDDVIERKPFSQLTERFQLARLTSFILELGEGVGFGSPELVSLVDRLKSGDASAAELEATLDDDLLLCLAGGEA